MVGGSHDRPRALVAAVPRHANAAGSKPPCGRQRRRPNRRSNIPSAWTWGSRKISPLYASSNEPHRRKAKRRIPCADLRRWPLGTAYTTVADDVANLAYRAQLKLPRIAADTTGVGTAVMEMIGQALSAKGGHSQRAQLCPVLITGGHAVSRGPDLIWHVAKVQLVSVLQALLSSRRLKIAKELAEAEHSGRGAEGVQCEDYPGRERDVRGLAGARPRRHGAGRGDGALAG